MGADIKNENVLAGIVGAFLFALLGGGLYFVIYQFGFIAGICGLITIILATFGYQLFSGIKNSLKGVIVAIVMTVIVIFAAEYFGVAYGLYEEFAIEGVDITFFDAVQLMPYVLSDSEALSIFIKDLLVAYVLEGIASFSNIKNAIAASRKKSEEKQ